LKIVKIITTNRFQGALRCETLFKEAKEELEIVGLKLAKVVGEGLENLFKKEKLYIISCMI
jgi:hypothetical protein